MCSGGTVQGHLGDRRDMGAMGRQLPGPCLQHPQPGRATLNNVNALHRLELGKKFYPNTFKAETAVSSC